ncbi:hypothetical protein [Marivivens marinus]|uniref:hypothetical protein n=1 Tax=Marivivens marinus TaxID=3110173 RepID=UPI003B845C94
MTDRHTRIAPGDLVIIRALDDIPEHLFRVAVAYEDCVGGYAISGPLAGEYGEPEYELILRVHSPSDE